MCDVVMLGAVYATGVRGVHGLVREKLEWLGTCTVVPRVANS